MNLNKTEVVCPAVEVDANSSHNINNDEEESLFVSSSDSADQVGDDHSGANETLSSNPGKTIEPGGGTQTTARRTTVRASRARKKVASWGTRWPQNTRSGDEG